MKREALSEHIFVLGIDGMDPRLTKKFLDQGKLPNIKKLVERGACREDLVLSGGVPTITPPMWTTLGTGANPGTHGITCFWGASEERIDEVVYNLDSRKCKAEPLWNVFAESGKKTLVWHWPGSSWPPTSDSPNLHVVDGANPGSVNGGIGGIDDAKTIYASADYPELRYIPKVSASQTGAGCIINDLAVEEEEEEEFDFAGHALSGKDMINIELSRADGEGVLEEMSGEVINSPISEPKAWEKTLPQGAKEVGFLFSNGLIRRYGLILPNQEGKYDTLEIYRSKKDSTPLGIATLEKPAINVEDEYSIDGKVIKNVRSFYIISMAEDGTSATFMTNIAMDISRDEMFHPKSLYNEVITNCGHVPSTISLGARNPLLAERGFMASWEDYSNWASKALNYLIETYNYSAIFSHHHNVDGYGHMMWIWAKDRKRAPQQHEEDYQHIMELVYEQTDRYIGSFLHLLDKGWTILLVSDHGLIVNEDEECSEMGDPFGVNGKVMHELGYHALKTDENGKLLKETDWEHTYAVAPRGNFININLKGREKWGIVDPKDKYALEDKIISDLYNYRDEDGERIIAIAMRTKDAALLGLAGEYPSCGDIVYWNVEHKGRVHGDTLPASEGYFDTSVSPIFIAAGAGIKKGYRTTRLIHSVDVAPTVAILGGVRMPRECEGAPAYQIFEEEI